MPYTAEHKQRSREKILAAAGQLFTQRGFSGVRIDDVMAEAGLTRGAFYAHFRSKSALYAEAIGAAGVKGLQERLSSKRRQNGRETLQQMARAYLSHQHLSGTAAPCPLAFLATDVVNADSAGQHAYTKAYQGLTTFIAAHLPGKRKAGNERRAHAIAALLIGGVAVGRAVDDDATVRKLLDSSIEAVIHMIGAE